MPETENPTNAASSRTGSPVEHLKEEIDALTQQQSNAIQDATYLGMSPTQAKEFAARRERIRKLVESLQKLKDAT